MHTARAPAIHRVSHFIFSPCIARSVPVPLAIRDYALKLQRSISPASRPVFLSELIFLMEDSLIDVRPKFLGYIENAVQANLGSPALICFDEGSILCGIVGIGNSCGGPVADNFRNIECRPAAVGAG